MVDGGINRTSVGRKRGQAALLSVSFTLSVFILISLFLSSIYLLSAATDGMDTIKLGGFLSQQVFRSVN